jgi:ethanolamine utilization protein EutQ|tara:strand:- start:118 stop:513 length:396 start_codon:yes stop_codon:yes gene_type:complete
MVLFIEAGRTVMKPSKPRVMEWAKSNFEPRFEHGDQAQAAHLCGTDDGSKLGAGFGRLTKASFEWTVQYDEVILVLEGKVTAITQTETLKAGRLDTIWLPAGTRVTYQAEDALIFYAIQPADWAQPNSTEG